MTDEPEERSHCLPPDREISRLSVVVAAKDQVSCDLSGEAVILNLKSGVYYGLDLLGARIWNLIQEPTIVGKVQEVILKEYEVEPEQCERDLLALLEKLAEAGLVDVKSQTNA